MRAQHEDIQDTALPSYKRRFQQEDHGCLYFIRPLTILKLCALPERFGDAPPKRLRYELFTLPGELVGHESQLSVRVPISDQRLQEIVFARGRLLAIYDDHRCAERSPMRRGPRGQPSVSRESAPPCVHVRMGAGWPTDGPLERSCGSIFSL